MPKRKPIDIKAKQDELMQTYMDLYQIAKSTIRDIKSGKQNITATLLRELNSLLASCRKALAEHQDIIEKRQASTGELSEQEKEMVDQIPDYPATNLAQLAQNPDMVPDVAPEDMEKKREWDEKRQADIEQKRIDDKLSSPMA